MHFSNHIPSNKILDYAQETWILVVLRLDRVCIQRLKYFSKRLLVD